MRNFQNIFIRMKSDNRKKFKILLCLLMCIIINCNEFKYDEKKDKAKNSKILDIDNAIQKPDRFAKLINIIKEKNCKSFKELIGRDFYYLLSDTSIAMIFKRENNFKESTLNVDVCNIIFDDNKLTESFFNLTGDNYNTYSPFSLLNSAKNLRFTQTVDSNSDFRIHFDIENIKIDSLEIDVGTSFLFKCDSNKFLNCHLEGFTTNFFR
ncbi:hypothetical protein [Leptospira limi]|uniref:Lipoprotein n=1 Tax=Leptospira limi TaxID=2950023 RepID=A0ABT3M2Q7_9LEPT|nr:hypothetical protein [Leptospira limi]MCW7464045.1 hypothetical protein [Leptospira limi]